MLWRFSMRVDELPHIYLGKQRRHNCVVNMPTATARWHERNSRRHDSRDKQARTLVKTRLQ